MILQLLAQLALVLLFAPLLLTVAKKTKAFWQNREGPPILQGYFDVAKLMRKSIVASERATWLFLATPSLVLACHLAASALVPFTGEKAPLAFAGDVFLLVYLFATARFLTAVAGLDSASPFGGFGSSREVTFGALIEPGLVASFLALAALGGGTDLAALAEPMRHGLRGVPATLALSLAALLILIVAELNRVPVDNPETHLEVTMVHEAMALEHTGPNLALLELANGVKHVVLLGLAVALFAPWTPAAPGALAPVVGALATLAKVAVLMVVIATSESWMAKWRVFRVPELTTVAFLLAFLAALGTVLAYGGA